VRAENGLHLRSRLPQACEATQVLAVFAPRPLANQSGSRGFHRNIITLQYHQRSLLEMRISHSILIKEPSEICQAKRFLLRLTAKDNVFGYFGAAKINLTKNPPCFYESPLSLKQIGFR